MEEDASKSTTAKTEKAKPRASWLRRWFRRACWTALAALVSLVAMHQYVVWSIGDRVFTVAQAPTRAVILVLGASVRPDGQPSHMLSERLRATASLYFAGKAPKVIVSGDHGAKEYDEVKIMARFLEDAGVPARDIFLDHAGFRTLDSMYRAKSVFGVDSMLVVSNPFHVPRAVFLGRSQGIDVVGVAAEYQRSYSTKTMLRHRGREVLARILAFCDVFFLGTQPKTAGPSIDLAGDGRTTRGR